MPTEAEILLKGFTEEERSDFLGMGTDKPFSANQVILATGQDESTMGIVKAGRVVVWVDRTRLAELDSGSTLGTSSVIEPHISTVVIRTETDGVMTKFERQKVLDFFRHRPERLFHQFCVNIYSIWVEILEGRNRRIFELQSALTVPASRQDKPRVLIVDDEDSIRDAFGDLLEDSYTILKAASGQEAIRMTHEDRPDILLLDLRMPGTDGFQVLQRLKGDPVTSHIPIMVITALTETSNKVKGLLHGADDYLTKPVDSDDLRGKLDQILRKFQIIVQSAPETPQ